MFLFGITVLTVYYMYRQCTKSKLTEEDKEKVAYELQKLRKSLEEHARLQGGLEDLSDKEDDDSDSEDVSVD